MRRHKSLFNNNIIARSKKLLPEKAKSDDVGV